MPVSPQDFALWSRMTGNPIPVTPADQMAAAPQVYNFVQNYSRGRDPFRQAGEGISQFIDTAGKAALTAGLLTGASLLAAKYAPRGAKPDAGVESGAAVAEAVTEKDPLDWMKSTETSSSGGSYIPTEVSVPASKLAAPTTKPAYRGIRGQIPYEAGELIPGQSETVGQIPGQEGKTMPGATTPGSFEDLLAQAREHTEGYYERGSSPEQAAMSELAKQKRTVDRATIQEAIGMFDSGEFLNKYAGKLQLDDEPQVDNDVVAAEPLSTVGRVSKDVTSADPASDINQRVLPNQTQEHVAEQSVKPQPETVAGNLATKQSPVHGAASLIAGAITGAGAAKDLLGKTVGKLMGGRQSVPAEVPPEAQAEAAVVTPRVAVNTGSTEYLGPGSREKGPLYSVETPKESMGFMKEMTFYPGGEIGITMPTKAGPQEYRYRAAVPMLEAMGYYAQRGFPVNEMGKMHTGSGPEAYSFNPKASGLQRLGLIERLTPEGTLSEEAKQYAAERQAQYAGLSPEKKERAAISGPTFGSTPAGQELRQKAAGVVAKLKAKERAIDKITEIAKSE